MAQARKQQKIQGTQPQAGKQKSSIEHSVEPVAARVKKPAEAPVERTGELLQQELEVEKAGIAAPKNTVGRTSR